MALIVQKYGGTSVGSIERIHRVADRVEQAVKEGNRVVVVLCEPLDRPRRDASVGQKPHRPYVRRE